jgi:hypothetical protein
VTKLKQAGPPVAPIAVIAGIVGYIVGSVNSEQDGQSAARAAETTLVAQNDNTAQQPAESEPAVSPVQARSPRDTYYPNTEDLAPDEIRVIACGTGMPTTRAAQAAACFLVELGNGDKFLFDIGSGSAERISSLQIPYDYLDKVFIGHLHGDHFGALGELFIGGGLMGRHVPLRVWGPSGDTPELGTAYAVKSMENMYAWDLAGRAGNVDMRGFKTDVTEFDYKGVHQVVYEANGVTIRSWPAIHCINGSVSFSLAEDFMVWNITKDKITERMAVVEERTWAPPPVSPPNPPNMADRKEMEQELGAKLSYSNFIKGGAWGGVEGVLRDIYKEASQELGREFPYPETTE